LLSDAARSVSNRNKGTTMAREVEQEMNREAAMSTRFTLWNILEFTVWHTVWQPPKKIEQLETWKCWGKHHLHIRMSTPD
jgi:hypothetical protein